MVKRLRKLKKNIRLHSEGTSTLILGGIALALLCMFFGYAFGFTSLLFYLVLILSGSVYLVAVNFFRCPIRLYEGETEGIVIAPEMITFNQLKRDNKIGCLTAVYDTQLLGKKYYMPAIRKRQDWGLFLSILRDCGRAFAIQEPLAYYRNRKNSVSSDKLGLIKYNILIYQKVLGFSKIKSVLYFYGLFVPTHLKKLLKRQMDSIIYICRKK